MKLQDLTFERIEHYDPLNSRMMIYNQADGRCVLCGRKIKYEDMTIYENAEVAGFMDYEEFKEYMLQFVK